MSVVLDEVLDGAKTFLADWTVPFLFLRRGHEMIVDTGEMNIFLGGFSDAAAVQPKKLSEVAMRGRRGIEMSEKVNTTLLQMVVTGVFSLIILNPGTEDVW